MKRKCDKCDQAATHHSVEITNGEKVEMHLCDEHAVEAGMAVNGGSAPINEILSNFVKAHGKGEVDSSEPRCENCGMTFSDFRGASLMGCPICYETFDAQISPLVERAQEGATHHLGKIPLRAGADEYHQQRILQIRKRLNDAIDGEDYELAARLRDEVQDYEDRLS